MRTKYTKMLEKRNEKLIQMLNNSREKEAGYEQIAKIHTAYISILLNKLGATESNAVVINGSEIKNALDEYEARATYDNKNDEYCLWCEHIGAEKDQ